MTLFSRFGICLLGVSMICTTACRSSNWRSDNDFAAVQAQRREKVQKSIGLKQSEAELQLARDAWTFGDSTACISALNGILEREPGHVEALLLQAEVHLAKNEMIEADRSLAIALSHDPSNATAKRLSEIARTKQLAERPQPPTGFDPDPAPLPAGAVSQVAYTPTDAGSALVGDQQHETFIAPVDPPIYVEPPKPETVLAPSATSETALAVAEKSAFPGFLQPLHSPHPGLQSWNPESLPTLPEIETTLENTDPPADPLADTTDPMPVPSSPESLPVLPEIETKAESVETPAVESLAYATDLMPVALTPEEGAAYELSDVPAGTAEISDQSSLDDNPAGKDGSPADQGTFLSPIAFADSASALAAVETDLTNNPHDPQIAISATVAALEANQPATAASIARLGIAFHPSCAGLHRTLGAALYRSGSYSSSQVALQQALSLDNSSALSYFLMGCVSEKLGDTEAAQTHFARATELDPTLANRE